MKTIKCREIIFKALVLLLVFVSETNMYSQNATSKVEGTIINVKDGFPVIGATVTKKGTSITVVSDFDGVFNINAKKGDVLVISSIGMNEVEHKVSDKKFVVSIKPNISELDEVVVVGYGAVKKKELTGAVSRVKSEAITQFVTSDVASALQGQVAGVNIVASNGSPGENSSIQIRGITSLSGSNTPLFVVDGIPQIGDPGLNPNEIETIDVLKDAASTAVYGTRGAAGVILVTTKKGKAGRMDVNFNANYGIQSLGSRISTMNTKEQLGFELARFNYTEASFRPGPFQSPEWLNNDNKFDELVFEDKATTKQYNLNVSGGVKDLTYNVSAGYYDQQGLLLNSGYKKGNARATSTYKKNGWRINSSLAFTLDKRIRTSEGLIVGAIRYAPYFPIIDLDSDVVITNGNNSVTTPLNNLAQLLKRKDNETSDRINGSLSIFKDISKELSIGTRIGTSVRTAIRNQFVPKFEVLDLSRNVREVDPTKSFVFANTKRWNSLSWDTSINYRKKIGNHKIGLQGTFALQQDSFQEFIARKEGVTNNNIQVLNGATINPVANSGFNSDIKTVGILARATYDYKGKYLLSALVRNDGSSKFGRENRWGVFPSVALAWNVSDEEYWKPIKHVVNHFKLRLSHGTVGNDNFAPYEYASTLVQGTDYIFDESDNAVDFGTAIKSYANRNVKWETSVSRNIGVDLSLFKNKIQITADYYVTNKKDMLFPVQLPGSTGAYYDPNVTLNVGNMTNKGFEFATKWHANIGKSKLNINGTFTKNNNEITKISGDALLYNGNSTLISGDENSTVTVLAKGYEVGSYFLYKTDGVIQTQEELDEYKKLPSRSGAKIGDLKYVDVDGDDNITVADRRYMGSALPDFEVGLNLKWMYKGFDVSMNWYGTVGAEILNGNKAAAFSAGRHKSLANMWTPENPTSRIPLYRGNSKSGSFNYLGTTDRWLEDGDYLRLKLITLGYNLPNNITKKMGLTNMRLFLSGQNILTFTKYSGYDPEVGGNNVARRGLDVSRYPLTSLYSLGVNFKF